AFARALAPLVVDAGRRAAAGAAARRRFEERFSVEVWAARTRRLYDEVLATGASMASGEA
ncbi:MAG TPA: hypothetical protein VGW10_13765, partial [Solirubrobacteraceae bacterium]|nr:hypothetical protein [Solirubrobacteraceae bacterium]